MEMAGERLDKALAVSLPDYSRNRLKTWVEAGGVMVDGKVTKARYLDRKSTRLNYSHSQQSRMPSSA